MGGRVCREDTSCIDRCPAVAGLSEKDNADVVGILAPSKSHASSARRSAKDQASQDSLLLSKELLRAVVSGEDEAAKNALDAGAFTEVSDEHGRTPLMITAGDGRIHLAALLLRQRADISATDAKFATPLHAAVSSGHLLTMIMLLDARASLEAGDSGAKTPLHWAAEKGQRQMVSLLLDRGADRRAKTREGKTPIDLAEERGDKACIGLLNEQITDRSTEHPDSNVSVVLGFDDEDERDAHESSNPNRDSTIGPGAVLLVNNEREEFDGFTEHMDQVEDSSPGGFFEKSHGGR
eukprot:TRINITY_DN90298_c0_g1_i1.p1 TRINITY_DN90298_c0_g1~~TRINITY_DN90298_c0_g1_i1.p1  ORF type:complete len:294 (-),score=63.85 TRINITY_DN90298_c0_g1_i1:302-1183(-)